MMEKDLQMMNQRLNHRQALEALLRSMPD